MFLFISGLCLAFCGKVSNTLQNRFSQGGTAGKKFTPSQKAEAISSNKTKNGGITVCEDCGVKTTPAVKRAEGVKVDKKETQVDHIYPKSKGGNTTPENRQILCQGCNNKKSNQLPEDYYKK